MRFMTLLIVALCSLTLYLIQGWQKQVQTQTQTQTVSTNLRATEFLNYRSAVMAYMTANPGFTGSIPATSLRAVSGQQFSTTFLAQTGNAETSSGSGVEVTVYSALPTGTLQNVVNQSGGDASIGVSAGSTWTTSAAGMSSAAQPLAVSVPAGDVVSVFVMGT